MAEAKTFRHYHIVSDMTFVRFVLLQFTLRVCYVSKGLRAALRHFTSVDGYDHKENCSDFFAFHFFV